MAQSFVPSQSTKDFEVRPHVQDIVARRLDHYLPTNLRVLEAATLKVFVEPL